MFEQTCLVIARKSVEQYISSNTYYVPDLGEMLEELLKPAGVFVTLYFKGELRGCVGTINPTRDCAAEEIAQNAVWAATRDNRFRQVCEEELPHLSYSVYLLEKPELISEISELDPSVYGVVVENQGRRGVLLPGIDGVSDAQMQVAIAKQKAGIAPNEPVALYRFEVLKFNEPPSPE